MKKIDSRTDATTSGLVSQEPPCETNDLILAYVPESEHLTYNEARALALRRDRQAAEQLRLSVPIEEIFVGYDGYFRIVEKPLIPPLDPRRTWGKI